MYEKEPLMYKRAEKLFETRESCKRQNHDHLHPEEERLLIKKTIFI